MRTATDLYASVDEVHCVAWAAARSESAATSIRLKYTPPMVTEHCKNRRISCRHNWSRRATDSRPNSNFNVLKNELMSLSEKNVLRKYSSIGSFFGFLELL